MSFTCRLCSQTRKLKAAEFTKIRSTDVEEKVKEAYKDLHGIPLLASILNEQVHKKCYRQYHSHYTNTCKIKRLSTEIRNCLLTDRLALVDRTNYPFSPSLAQTTTSTNHYSQQNSVHQAYVVTDTTCTSYRKTSSATTNINQKSEISCNIGNFIDLQQDFKSSRLIEPHFSPSAESSSIEPIYQKESFKITMESSITEEKNEFNDLIEIIDTNASSSITIENLESVAHDDNICSKTSHNEQSYRTVHAVDSQQNCLDSSRFIDQMFSPLFESSFIRSPPSEAPFIRSSSIEAPFNRSPPTETPSLRSPPIKAPFIRSPSSQSSFTRSSLIQLSPVHSVNQKNSFKTKSQLSKARKKIDFNQFVDMNNTNRSSRGTTATKSISSRLRSRYPTHIRQQSKNFIQYPIDERTKSFLYDNSFRELCDWLQNILRGGCLVALVMVKEKYQEILQLRNELITEAMLRTTSIRDRLYTKFKNRILFTKVNNRLGTYICWNNLSTITQSTLTNSLTLENSCTFQSNNIYKDPENEPDKESQSKILFQAIELLRDSLHENMPYLKQVHKNDQSLAEFTSGLFWDCIPITLKNVIGLLTTSDNYFQQFKNHVQYLNIFNQDMYKLSEKSLKISSIVYDIINARYDTYSTPKHLLLGNELFHHVRSSHLLNIMNRFGHTCSYETAIRLQKKAARAVSKLSSSDLPSTVEKQHSFVITVADNFDMNIGTLRGEDSIHILNRIIIQTPVNDELKFDVHECLNGLCASIVSALDDPNFNLLLNSNTTNSTTNTTSSTTNKNQPYVPYEDNSHRDMLLAYGLMKHAYNTNNFLEKVVDNQAQMNLPLLAGFFATYIQNVHRPLSKITFLPPINQNPSSLTTSQLCLQSTKSSLIDSGYQKEAVVVVDEKIYSNCIKAKRLNELDNKSIFLYAGDFHIMKNFMVVIWDVLIGSGVEDILGCIYKAAAHRSIINVHNFNYSLRCCKLLYTALSVLFIDSFIQSLSSSSYSTAINDILDKLKTFLKSTPSDYAVTDIKQKWFSYLVDEINKLNLSDVIQQWALEQCKTNQAFRFWYFVYRHLLEPLILMYTSIRLSNFNGRNAALSSMAPIFFATNHRNYARLAAQHLLDLQSCSVYLRERLERSFTVSRTNRPFSAIALDQAIECSINKYGKGRGGITGKLNTESIDVWCNSFAFRSTLSSIVNEIAGIERTNNTLDAHAECSFSRMTQDNKDLSIITKMLYDENLFKTNNVHVRKIMNGKIIHQKIIENVVTMYERGLKNMHSFIQERYIDRSVNIYDRLSGMIRLKLSDPYVSSEEQRSKNKRNSNDLMTKTAKKADNIIKDIISLSSFRKLDMDLLFAHEFSPAPLSLCDNQDCNLLNQQQKSEIIKLFEKECPGSFSTNNPTITNDKWALLIDGGQLLEVRPLKTNGTILDYAKQLLLNNIIPEFRIYDRVDIIFDSDKSKVNKSFIRRHGCENAKQQQRQQQQYDLKENDILESSRFHEFVHSNRAKLAAVVRSCWSQDELVHLLPIFKHFVIAGPQQETVKLINNSSSSSSEILYTLQSDHIEADTRIFLHVYDIQMNDDDGRFDGIVIQSSDTDILILSIAHIKLMMLPNYFIKKFNTSTKLSTFINIKEIAKLIKNKWNINEPNVFLALHAISGCDTTSFIRNITKTNYFTSYLSNPNQYHDLIKFGDDSTITTEPLKAAEELLISCYTKARGFKSSTSSSSSRKTTTSSSHTSLDSLRTFMAFKHFKNQTSDLCIKLPPTSDSFNQHCRRAWRQVYIWKNAFESFDLMNCYPIEDYGYERANNGELIIQWMTIPVGPDDISLSRCIKCTTGCQRCKCSTNNLPCTPFCGCSVDQCTNRTSARMKIQSTGIVRTTRTTPSNKKCTFDDDLDEDTDEDSQTENQPDIDCEDEDVLESIYENDQSDASSISSSSSSCLNNDETQADLMNMSIATEHSYCCQTTSRSSNGLNNATKKNLTSSPLQSPYVSNLFDNLLSPIDRSKNVKITSTLHKKLTKRSTNKRKPVKSIVDKNSSSHSTPSQIIPRKKKF